MENVNEGVVGIVAGRLSEKYKVPAIVLTNAEEGLMKGSARSYGDINIKEAMDAAKDHIVQYGGHSGAGGLTVDPDQLGELYDKMSENIRNQSVSEVESQSTIYYDLDLPIEKLDETIEQLLQYAPFGEGNEPIVFKINKFTLSPKGGQFAKLRGAQNEHITFSGTVLQRSDSACRINTTRTGRRKYHVWERLVGIILRESAKIRLKCWISRP